MYGEDLASIHDQGYSSGAERTESFIVQMLRSKDVRQGHIFAAGCGSGHSTAVFSKADYNVLLPGNGPPCESPGASCHIHDRLVLDEHKDTVGCDRGDRRGFQLPPVSPGPAGHDASVIRGTPSRWMVDVRCPNTSTPW